MKKLIVIMLSAMLTLGACQEKNPLLTEWNTPFGTPPFKEIKLEHYMPAIEEAMRQHQNEVNAIINNQEAPTFENTILAYDNAGSLLSKITAVFYGINSANTTPEMKKMAVELSPKMSKHSDDIRLNPELFKKIKMVYEQRDNLDLTHDQMRLLTEMYKGFERSGANLTPEQQEKLKQLNTEISKLQTAFGQNVLAETAGYTLSIQDERELDGLTASQIAEAASRAEKRAELEKDMVGGWIFGLDNPSIMPFLQYAENRDLREKMLEAYLNRANHNDEHDNKDIVKKLLSFRMEKAQLMGYPNFAEFVLADRMAKNAKNVYDLLDQLWTPALNVAKSERTDLQKMMDKEVENEKLQDYDWRYYNEKVKTSKFDLNDEMIRPYFKMENVRDGIFYVANQLYGITFTQVNDVPVPTDETAAYECKDKDGTHLGLLYLDMFPRPGAKNGGAWCGRYRGQSYKDGKRVAPLVTIVCNFTRPVGDKPALLSPDEAETFFHEFGHALHGLFADVKYKGISGVPRDFVELPSQIMEHWCFEPEVLKQYAKHYETGEVIPQTLIDKLDKSGKYGEGFKTTEYLAASYLDMDYHVMTDIPANLNISQFEKEVLNTKRGLINQIPPRYRTTYFTHTMGGGYTAGYYSYIWAEVLDCDAFQAFKETGDIFNREIADRFRKEILSRGGEDDAMQMYLNFRGTPPTIKGLLENRGLN